MKAERPSRTAHFVALGRAIADLGVSHIPDFKDPTARVFLNERGKRSLAKTTRVAREGKRSVALEMARGMADLIGLRTVAIDAAVRDAIDDGATQLVILGAGYDGRAWRMPDLSGVKIFEVDHPATQSDKRSHLSELPPPRGAVGDCVAHCRVDCQGAKSDQVSHAARHFQPGTAASYSSRVRCPRQTSLSPVVQKDARCRIREIRQVRHAGIGKGAAEGDEVGSPAGTLAFQAYRAFGWSRFNSGMSPSLLRCGSRNSKTVQPAPFGVSSTITSGVV